MDSIKTTSECFQKLNEFRKEKVLCDVTITSDGKKILCHRLVLSSASSYFNGMFKGNFNESKEDIVELTEEIHAITFEEILDAMYTGEISITSKNVYHLWKACSFFGMPVFENQCVEFIKKNLPVYHLVEVCLFADVLKMNDLLEILANYIAGNIIELSKTNDFSLLSFDMLKLIVSQQNVPRGTDDIVFSIIASWGREMNSSNKTFTEELLNAAKLTKLSASLMAQFIVNPDALKVFQIDEQSSTDSNVQPKLEIVSTKSYKNTLKVYLKAFNKDCCLNDTIVLEYDCLRWNSLKKLNNSFKNLKTVWVGNRQYFLARDFNNTSPFDTLFWMVEDGKVTQLREPPVNLEEYRLAVPENTNTIYLYCSSNSSPASPSISISLTTNSWGEKQVLENCVFVYNCELNTWLSTPKIPVLVSGACLVTYKNSVNVVCGSTNFGANYVTTGGLQQYDFRCPNWMVYNIVFQHYYGAACVRNDEMYVCGTRDPRLNTFLNTTSIYDFKAQKCDTLESMKAGRANHVLILYNDFLYAVDNRNHPPVERYDLGTKTWGEVPTLPRNVLFDGHVLCTRYVLDAII